MIYVHRVTTKVDNQLLRGLLRSDQRGRPLSFRRTTFVDRANFRHAVFTEHVSFDDAVFQRGADFQDAEFLGHTSFNRAVFHRPVDFRRAFFAHGATFPGTLFLAGRAVEGMRAADSADDAGSESLDRDAGDVGVQVLQAVGSAAALGLWITFVGGAMVFARLEAANAPRPTRTVTLVSKDVLLAEGAHAMAGVLVIAVAAALLMYFVAREDRWRDPTPQMWTAVGHRLGRPWPFVLAAVVVAPIVVWFSPWKVRWFVFGIVAAAGVVLLSALAVRRAAQATRWSVPAALAAVIFATVVVLGGITRFTFERGNEEPAFERARVVFADGLSFGGLLVGRGKEEVTLICAHGYLKTVSTKGARQLIFRKEVALKKRSWRCTTRAAKRTKPVPAKTVRIVLDVRTREGRTVVVQGAQGDRGPRGKRGPQGETGLFGFSDILIPGEAPALPDVQSVTPDRTGRGFLVTLGRFDVPVVGVAQFLTRKKYPLPEWDVPRQLKLATASFRTAGHGAVTIHAALSPTARGFLRHEHGFEVAMRVTALGAGGRATIRRYPLSFPAL